MKMISWDSISDPEFMSRFGKDNSENRIAEESASDSSVVRQARSEAIQYIGLGMKSSGRIMDRLKHKDYDRSVIDQVMAGLRDDGYLQDDRIARRIMRQRSGRQGLSRALLRMHLLAAGLSEEAVEQAIQAAPTDEETIGEVFAGRFPDKPDKSDPDKSDKDVQDEAIMVRFLQRRGYSYELSRRTVRACFQMITHESEES